MKTDVLFINPNSAVTNYQGLSSKYSAIEPPTWALLLAESVRSVGFNPKILDCDAERLDDVEATRRVIDIMPRLVLFVVYGQNPNSSTSNMSGALALANNIKQVISLPVAFVGAHVAAVPLEVLSEPSVDIVFLNEGVYALRNLLSSDLSLDLPNIKGIGYKVSNSAMLNDPETTVPQDKMDQDLPGYAWDLLPKRFAPLDLYRSHYWHSNFSDVDRSPFAAIYTSLGCNFKCDFCMINIINRTDNRPGISAADSAFMRFWSVDWVIKQLKILKELGVRHVRLNDEMFFLNKKYYVPLLERIISEDLNFNFWAYARCDSVREEMLPLFKNAGINWLALGIESGSYEIRREISKGSFKSIDVRELIRNIEDQGISVIANYIFGLPGDTYESMNSTLDMAIELNTDMINMYPCQPLPGSPMHAKMLMRGFKNRSFSEYSFYSYDSRPLPTESLTSGQIVAFRDMAWEKYMSNENYLSKVEKKFGSTERRNIERLLEIKLKRRGDAE